MTDTFAYDPLAPGFQDELFDVYRVLRDESPVYRSPNGGFFALSRFDDVLWAAHDTETFSSTVAEAELLMPMMVYMDPPRHTALRALVSRAFTPRRVAALEEDIRSVVSSLLDAMDGGCEFVSEFAALLPSIVVGRLIGLPDEQLADFRSVTDALLTVTESDESHRAGARMYALIHDLLEERRREPREDLMRPAIATSAPLWLLTRR